MEKHFLSDYVDGEPGFRPEPWYNPYGDCIIYRTANEAIVADRIDELLTIYRSALDDRPIGFQIKGMRAIIHKFKLAGLATIVSETANGQILAISVSALLFAAYLEKPETPERREAYKSLIPFSGAKAEIPVDELSAAM